MTQFLFPSDPIRLSVVDEMFADQKSALAAEGHTCALLPDAVLHAGRPLRNIVAKVPVVYRGWMLNAREYATLHAAVLAQGATMLTNPDQYLAAHHLPRWYPLIADLTPETRELATDIDPVAQLRKIGWSSYFVKDYVKSLKTARGSIVSKPEEIGELIADMVRYRGEIEGGVCVRRIEDFVPETERRYFVLRGRPHASDASKVPEIVRTVANRIALPFYSVDVIERRDGIQRVVEVGDGQVSDLVGWSVEAFARIWTF